MDRWVRRLPVAVPDRAELVDELRREPASARVVDRGNDPELRRFLRSRGAGRRRGASGYAGTARAIGFRYVPDARTRQAPARAGRGSVIETRIAGAPISWGVCEVPGWGVELPPDRVLAEMASLGLRATEAGPVGYLGTEQQEIVSVLTRHGLQLVGAFLPVVLHERSAHEDAVASAHETCGLLEAADASFLISAVVVDLDWSPRVTLTDGQWQAVFEGLSPPHEGAR